MRATDQRRPRERRILDDPHAKLFLGPATRAALAALEASGKLGDLSERALLGLTTYVLTRHRFIDDRIRAAFDAGGVEQLVLLGAGYDTRAYRFAPLPNGCRIYEVDHPSTGRRKARIAAAHAGALPRVPLRTVEIDFQTQSLEERLVAAGFKKGVRTFFVWEGVSMYLTRAAVKDTLSTIRRLGGPGSELAMDFWFLLDSPDLVSTTHRMSASLLHFLGEPITFGVHPEDVGSFLSRLGFDTAEIALASTLEARYVQDARKVYPANYVVHARVA